MDRACCFFGQYGLAPLSYVQTQAWCFFGQGMLFFWSIRASSAADNGCHLRRFFGCRQRRPAGSPQPEACSPQARTAHSARSRGTKAAVKSAGRNYSDASKDGSWFGRPTRLLRPRQSSVFRYFRVSRDASRFAGLPTLSRFARCFAQVRGSSTSTGVGDRPCRLGQHGSR